jgi:hypothetical protein
MAQCSASKTRAYRGKRWTVGRADMVPAGPCRARCAAGTAGLGARRPPWGVARERTPNRPFGDSVTYLHDAQAGHRERGGMAPERPGHRASARACEFDPDGEDAASTACIGICLVSVDVWPRVAAHGPVVPVGLWYRNRPVWPRVRREGGDAVKATAGAARFADRISNGRDDRADHREVGGMHGANLDIESQLGAGCPTCTSWSAGCGVGLLGEGIGGLHQGLPEQRRRWGRRGGLGARLRDGSWDITWRGLTPS